MHASLRAIGASFFFTSFTVTLHAADSAQLEEVVVTADLRERALDSLPSSATVLDSGTLETAGVQHLQDVLALVPNLNWSSGTSRPRFFQLRGIGELEQWQGAPNPSVGFLIDGIDFSGLGMAATLVDVESIEVLRGPQGTAYGANALAGLIAINTRAPTRDAQLDGKVTLGDHGTYGANAVLGGALGSGDAAWRLVAGNYRGNGFRRNSFLDRDDTNGYNESMARFRLSGRPTENLSADFTAMWADLDNGYDAFSIDNSRTTLSDKPGQDTQLTRAASLRLAYSGAAGFDVVSRTAVGKTRGIYSFDADWGNDAGWGVNAPYDWFQRFARDHQTFSEDLRLVSRDSVESGAASSWLAGVYLLRTDEDLEQLDTWNDAGFGAGEALFASRYRATNLAAYAQLEWRLGATNVLSVGGRGERRSADYRDTGEAAFAPEETMFGGNLSLRHAFGEQASGYVTVARGYKAGGFNIGAAVPAESRSFEAEILTNFEIGLRGKNLDRSLQTELALFYMQRGQQQVHTGVQLELGNPSSFVQYLDNAASGENYGVEATLAWRPRASLLLDLRGAALETRYRGYLFNTRNLDGREQAHAPQYQYDFGVEYRPTANFFARVDFAGMDDFYFGVSHDDRAPARVLTNLKMGLSGTSWRAELWVQNLFDEYYAQRGFHFGNEPPDFAPTRYVQAGDTRHAGITVEYTFR